MGSVVNTANYTRFFFQMLEYDESICRHILNAATFEKKNTSKILCVSFTAKVMN